MIESITPADEILVVQEAPGRQVGGGRVMRVLEFANCLKRLTKKTNTEHLWTCYMQGNFTMATLVKMLAEESWLQQLPEDEDTKALREQLRNMAEGPGYMLFDTTPE